MPATYGSASEPLRYEGLDAVARLLDVRSLQVSILIVLGRIAAIAGSLRRRARRMRTDRFPLKGFEPSSVPVLGVDDLSDDELLRLNNLLPWKCFTVDSRGRRFGDRAWPGKREEPQQIPDPRIERFHSEFDLADKHVLEVGCFEGVHTIGLCCYAREVTAIDARVENVVKTIVRAALYGHRPRVLCCDVEIEDQVRALPDVDLVHHVGVLYHLSDPVRHLRGIADKTRVGMMLDTHVATPARANRRYDCDGVSYTYMPFRESGVDDVFSGMYDHAKWLTLETISSLLREVGFRSVRQIEERAERNGLRVLLHARR